jgi:3-oxoacyl-[acyl-carrier-protein] synthase-3
MQPTENGDGIIGSALACVGGGKKPGMRILGGGTNQPLHEQVARPRFMSFEVDVVEAGRFTPFVMAAALKSILEKCNVSALSIDHCVIPEGNAAYVLDELRESGQITAEWTTLQSKIRENLAQVGATGSACVPLALDHAWRSGVLHNGDRVMLAAIETSKWLFAGTIFPWSAGASPN